VPDLLDQIRTDVHARLSELRPLVEEHRRLQTALRALTAVEGDASGPAAVGSAGTGAMRTSEGRQAHAATPVKRRPRAPRGANRQAVLAAVRERPGASVAEIAAISSVKRNTLHGVLRRLVQQGEVQTRKLPTGRTGYALGDTQPAEPPQPAELPQPAEPLQPDEPAGEQPMQDARGEKASPPPTAQP
jgi:hypothetical protein